MSSLNYKKISLPLITAIAVVFGLYLGKFIYNGNGPSSFKLDFTSNSSTHKIQRILDAVENYYVDSINYLQIEDEVIQSVLKQLDPHSVYIPASKMQMENDRMEGAFGGVGIQFKVVKDTILVLKVVEKSPAEKSGLKNGDKIIAVNDSVFAGIKLELENIVSKLRGEQGTDVKIGILRKDTILSFDVTRGTLPINSVDYAHILDSSIGYIKINRFSKTTMKEFKKATKNWDEKSLNGMIVDLRGNPGGLLEEVIELCDEFLPEGKMIVFTKDKYATEERLATQDGRFQNIPLTILIDEGSASASEIFAGSMQDNDRAIIIGRRSFGKGLVQRPFDLKDGSVLRLTIARYYTPVGRSIQRDYGKNKTDYYNEISNRLTGGELLNRDSIVVEDSLKYTTPKGKIVYGGGGIIPDLFIPIDTVINDELILRIYQEALVELFVIERLDDYKKLYNEGIEISYNKALEQDVTRDFYTYIYNKLELKLSYDELSYELKNKLQFITISELLEYVYGETGGYYPFLLKDRAVITAKQNLIGIPTIPNSTTNLNTQP